MWDSHLSAASAPGSSAGCQRPHVFEPGSFRGAPRRRSSPTEAPPSLQPDPLPGDARGLRRVLRGVPRGDSPCVFSPRVEMGAQRAPRFRAAAAARSLCLPVPTCRDTRPSALERRPGFPGSPHSAHGPATPRLSPESTVAGGSRSGPGGTFRVSREHAPINRPEDGRALERRSGASPQGVALGPRETYIPSGCLSFLPVKQDDDISTTFWTFSRVSAPTRFCPRASLWPRPRAVSSRACSLRASVPSGGRGSANVSPALLTVSVDHAIPWEAQAVAGWAPGVERPGGV